MSANCRECQWSKRRMLKEIYRSKLQEYYFCYRFPPQFRASGQQIPAMTRHQFCGEFKKGAFFNRDKLEGEG